MLAKMEDTRKTVFKTSIQSLAVRALYEAMSVDTMVRIAKEFFQGYDIHDRTGFPSHIPMQSRDAAGQIVKDMVESGFFVPFVERLITMEADGFLGRGYKIERLPDLVREFAKDGFFYDSQKNLIVEKPGPLATRTWRRLCEGVDYPMVFLRFDIVGNTKLTRTYGEARVQGAYGGLFRLISERAAARNARVWNLEGDGGLLAFYFNSKELDAVALGIEVLHDLFVMNRQNPVLGEPLLLRIGVHSGICKYSAREEELAKEDTIRRVKDIETNWACPGGMTVSNTVAPALPRFLLQRFKKVKPSETVTYHSYAVRWEGDK